VIYAYLISLAFAAVISVIFIKFIQYWSPALNFLGQSPILGVWFTISTMLWCIFVLQDSVLTGLRRASLVPLENTVFSLTKIVLMLVFAVSIPSLGIFASWSFALIVAIIPTSYFIFKKLIPLHVQQDNHDASQVDPRQVVRYVAPDYLGSIFWLITTTLMPLIVTTIAGATANAYYYLAWTIANTLYLIGPSMGSSLIVEASTDPQRLAVYSYRVFKNSVKLVFPAALIIAIGAPLILMVFGKDYSSEGALLLRFLALSAIPSLINAIFVSVSRVQRRMTAVLATSAAIYSMILGFSFIFLKTIGIAGVGLAWLLSQLIVAVVVFVTQLRDFWRRSGDISGESEDALLKAARPVFWIHWMYQFAYATKLLPVLTLIKRQWHLRKRRLSCWAPNP
jgi:O-antigen/teichoic acid export membrane protein